MTYSNTNKDKIQANLIHKSKNIIITILLLITIIYSGGNIINQYVTLKEAKRVNAVKQNDITNLKEKITELRQKVEYATTSAYKARRMRQFYGLGLVDDKWIVIEKSKKESNIGQDYNVAEDKPNIVLWWEKFIK